MNRGLSLFMGSIAVLFFGHGALLADNPPVNIQVDAAQDHHPISPLIYGVSYGSSAVLNALNSPINRHGGNRTTRYNYLQNVDATAADWYFESYPGSSSQPGEIVDSFITDSKNGNAEPMITVPIIDWIARTDAQRHVLCSFSVATYGAQQAVDPYDADCGNGILLNGNPVINNPADAGTANSPAFEQGLIQHLLNSWGNSGNGGVKYYLLDNEHSIWYSTHRDVHPIGPGMDEMWGKMRDYAAMIKAQDGGALVAGPEEWGWTGFLMSGLDMWTCSQPAPPPNCWSNPPDRTAHGAAEYVTWVLDQFKAYDDTNQVRLLDVFSLHFYPQSGEFSNDTSTGMQQLRNRSTRGLWDPNYLNESWIQDYVKLIPRMKEWVAGHYPGTLTAITEYNWGADDHINGATTQADILGIFGREGLDIGTRWTAPAAGSQVANAFKMYRNYDGNKSTFGDTNVRATVPDATIDNLSSFAAVRSSDGALTIMVISKYLSANTPVTVSLAGFSDNGSAESWRLNNDNTMTHLPDVPVSSNSFSDSVPRQTVTLYVVHPLVPPVPDFTLSCSPTTVFAAPGGSGDFGCTLTSIGSFSNPVTLSCPGLPAGATCTFSTNPVTPTGNTSVTVNVGSGVVDGAYPFTVSGTDGSITHGAPLTLSVSSGPVPLLFDDFEDDVKTWTEVKGAWAESGGSLTGSGKTAVVFAPQPWSPSGQSSCSTCTLETDLSMTGGIGSKVFVQHWYQNKGNRVDLLLKDSSDTIILKQVVDGTIVKKAKATLAIVPNTSYHIKLGFDGANIFVEVDGVPKISVPAATPPPQGNLGFKIKNTTASIAEVVIY